MAKKLNSMVLLSLILLGGLAAPGVAGTKTLTIKPPTGLEGYVDNTGGVGTNSYLYVGTPSVNPLFQVGVFKISLADLSALSGTIVKVTLKANCWYCDATTETGYFALDHFTVQNNTPLALADGDIAAAVERIGAVRPMRTGDFTWDVTDAVKADLAQSWTHTAFRLLKTNPDGSYLPAWYPAGIRDIMIMGCQDVGSGSPLVLEVVYTPYQTQTVTVMPPTEMEGYVNEPFNTVVTDSYLYVGTAQTIASYDRGVWKLPLANLSHLPGPILRATLKANCWYHDGGGYFVLDHYPFDNHTPLAAADGDVTLAMDRVGEVQRMAAGNFVWDVTALVTADLGNNWTCTAFRMAKTDSAGAYATGGAGSGTRDIMVMGSQDAGAGSPLVLEVMYEVGGVPAELSPGHRILIEKGLQLQAQIFPRLEDTGVEVGFSLSRFAESNFTTANFHYNNDCNLYLGDPATCPFWGRIAGYGLVDPGEMPYLDKMVSFQYGDELDMTNPTTITLAAGWMASNREGYPDVISYTNEEGHGATADQMRSYMATAKPDMVMFDEYAFNGSLTGGSPTVLYECMQKYRGVALAGNDGTGQTPIPYALYTQTFSFPGQHVVAESEMALNQFAAWAFGFKYISAFTYTSHSASMNLIPVLFNGVGDSSPTDKFYQMAEINRQSRNLGPALVRLLSTDVRMVMGRHGSEDPNTPPAGVTTGIAGADPYITAITAANAGSKNNGKPGDVIVGFFKPLHESFDGLDYADQKYFMITNGLSDAAGTALETRQNIRIDFNFGASGITGLQRLSRTTGQVETVTLMSDGGSLYHLDLVLDGGTGDLFKFNTGAPFVGFYQPVFPVLAVGPEGRLVGAGAGTTTFNVSNFGGGTLLWSAQVISGGSWLSISSGTSGTNGGLITTAFTKNNDPANVRTGTLRIWATGAFGTPRDVTVIQAKGEQVRIPGDANLDNKVNVSDLGLLAANYGKTAGVGWTTGDFNADGKVDVSDLGLLAAHYGEGTGASLDFDADAAALGLVAGDAKQDPRTTDDSSCTLAGLPLVAGLFLMGMFAARLEG